MSSSSFGGCLLSLWKNGLCACAAGLPRLSRSLEAARHELKRRAPLVVEEQAPCWRHLAMRLSGSLEAALECLTRCAPSVVEELAPCWSQALIRLCRLPEAVRDCLIIYANSR